MLSLRNRPCIQGFAGHINQALCLFQLPAIPRQPKSFQ
jgi:hypothetical protein